MLRRVWTEAPPQALLLRVVATWTRRGALGLPRRLFPGDGFIWSSLIPRSEEKLPVYFVCCWCCCCHCARLRTGSTVSCRQLRRTPGRVVARSTLTSRRHLFELFNSRVTLTEDVTWNSLSLRTEERPNIFCDLISSTSWGLFSSFQQKINTQVHLMQLFGFFFNSSLRFSFCRGENKYTPCWNVNNHAKTTMKVLNIMIYFTVILQRCGLLK